MFAGLAQLKLSEKNASIIEGMSSREGELVMFKEPVNVEQNPSIQDWLSMIEYQMRFTLASLLEDAIARAGIFCAKNKPFY